MDDDSLQAINAFPQLQSLFMLELGFEIQTQFTIAFVNDQVVASMWTNNVNIVNCKLIVSGDHNLQYRMSFSQPNYLH